ncbi:MULTISPECIES: hypothetical protein [unclassified Methylobacterium]|uniref:hypothetical protein n=1 Tax=unclassified Methylobacterium TaxID=2615210 RepID=UPI001FCD6F05|nr:MULTISPECIES: hypothetical protein [unclassified Methylobacterium]
MFDDLTRSPRDRVPSFDQAQQGGGGLPNANLSLRDLVVERGIQRLEDQLFLEGVFFEDLLDLLPDGIQKLDAEPIGLLPGDPAGARQIAPADRQIEMRRDSPARVGLQESTER